MYVTSPPASTIEPLAIVANTLEGPGHHLGPRIMIAVAWASFSLPQLDTSIATEAHSELTVGSSTTVGETGEHPLAGHPRVHPVHKDRA